MPTPPWWLFVLPLLAGACLPLQAGINGQLAKQVSSVLAAALISFFVGTLGLLALTLAARVSRPGGIARAGGTGAAVSSACSSSSSPPSPHRASAR